MPKQITQWQCEICGHSVPGWTEADAMECEASHVRIQQIKELHYAYPGDKYPSKITILFSDGECQEFISNLSSRNVATSHIGVLQRSGIIPKKGELISKNE